MRLEPTPKNIKEQQAMDYALYEMATSMFGKVVYEDSILKDRLTLAWREISRNSQYDAEDKILKILDKSPLAKESFAAEERSVIAKVIRSKDKTHYAVRLIDVNNEYELILEVNPYVNKKNNYKRYTLSLEEINDI